VNAKGHAAASVVLLVVSGQPIAAQSTQDVQKAILALAPGQSTKIGSTTYTMHQRGAGAPDPGGWYHARSIGAGYTVAMPVPFSELTSSGPTTDGSVLDSHTVGGGSADGARFMVNCMRRADGKVAAGWAEDVANGLLTGRTLVNRSVVTRRGTKGISLELSTASVRSHAELVEVNGYTCQLTVEYPPALMPKASKQARAFFDSFAFP
jgi:hypothetical protein